MKKNVLVTATGGRSVGSGIVHALFRSSLEVKERWNIISADANSFAWGLYITELSAKLPFVDDSNYISEIKNVVNIHNIDAIIPGSESECNILSKFQNEISVPIICNNYDLMPLMMDKFKMAERVKQLGLPVIETFSLEKYKDAIVKYDFPFIIKPTIGTGGSRGLNLVFTEDEIEVLLNSTDNQYNFCIQPYIGTCDDEYTVGVLCDKDSQIIDSIVMKRKLIGLSLLESKKNDNKTYSISTGYSQGYFIKNDRIQTFCENLALSLDSRGPLNIQLRIKDDKIFIFEIHPRFSGTSPMRADVGFNEADILLRNFLFNEKFGRIDYKYDVAVIRAFEHIIVPINEMK